MFEREMILKKRAVFSTDKKKRFEFNLEYEGDGKKKKSILVIGLFPSSNDLYVTDTTTNYILNNLLPMKYTSITICNLFATIGTKITAQDMDANGENIDYLQDMLKKGFDTVLIGYGNSMAGNKRLIREKEELDLLLKDYKGNVVELVDKDNMYSRLHTIHPLFAGQRFSGQWKFRKYVISEKDVKEKGEETNVHQNE